MENKTVQTNLAQKTILPYSLMVLIRTDLRMKPGKIAAQSIHAALGACYKSLDKPLTIQFMKESLQRRIICLKVENEKEMLKIQEKMTELKINTFIQVDLGFTQVPAYTQTAMAIGPDLTENFAEYIKHLALY